MNINRAVKAWKNMMLLFPKGMISFVWIVSGLCLGLSLLIVWVGIPILILTLVPARRMLELEEKQQAGEKQVLAEHHALSLREAFAADSWRVLLKLLSEKRTYLAILFGIGQLPVSIAALTLALTLPIAAFGVLLSPLSYVLNSLLFGFQFDTLDVVLAPLFTWATPFQRSWIAAAIGLALVLLLPVIFHALGQCYRRWVSVCCSP